MALDAVGLEEGLRVSKSVGCEGDGDAGECKGQGEGALQKGHVVRLSQTGFGGGRRMIVMRTLVRLFAVWVSLAGSLVAADLTGIWMGEVPGRNGEKQDLAFRFQERCPRLKEFLRVIAWIGGAVGGHGEAATCWRAILLSAQR